MILLIQCQSMKQEKVLFAVNVVISNIKLERHTSHLCADIETSSLTQNTILLHRLLASTGRAVSRESKSESAAIGVLRRILSLMAPVCNLKSASACVVTTKETNEINNY